MTPVAVLAAIALRAAMPTVCPATDRPPILVVERDPHGRKGHFDSLRPDRIYIDPRTPRALVPRVVRHEVAHWCRFNAGRADWAMNERVTPW